MTARLPLSDPSSGDFPTLVVRGDGFGARGAFAQAQAEVLDPDGESVAALTAALRATNTGVVAHFYMDPELQGVLYASDWPHIHVSDSLLMADKAVSMADAGVDQVIVLGVDFMSENVRAMVDAAGHEQVGVWRVSDEEIGCSLAEAAQTTAYAAFLEKAAATPKPLHVIYINTSLRTKARAHHRVPTITCTSSNVVQTILQATAQDPGLSIFFGPDTYMGQNLEAMFRRYAAMSDAEIAALHPAHDRRSLARLIDQFHYFGQGNCIVHHMFGAEVVRRVEALYERDEIHVTAHLEVPGEMFELALRASHEGRGVVGSTSNILSYVKAQVEAGPRQRRLGFVLGTEAGMVTAIVRSIRGLLGRPAYRDIEVEILFPVAAEAVTRTSDAAMPLVPGVAGGEGCTAAGGCATCPYMKMNSLDALMDLLRRVPGGGGLEAFAPRKYEELIGGHTVAELGREPILHMRGFQRSGKIPDGLLQAVATHLPSAPLGGA